MGLNFRGSGRRYNLLTKSSNSGNNCVGLQPDSVTNLGHLRKLTYLPSTSASFLYKLENNYSYNNVSQ